ncbi:phosphatidylserine/phosphatidylglycerophosphate/cardiolipin synthase family protein [Prosthecobacter sp.]|uniref:phosphatidylserine/phosphatidylglycerophosphate/ cardiolipin synthase family protein n=1 Tax=Prosthecobacter sp. TaxID=1965333 RepID=UPI0037844EF8
MQRRHRHERDADARGGLKLAASLLISGVAGVFIARNFFETDKKIQHLIDPTYSVGDPSFCRTVSHLLGPPLIAGNTVETLENGRQIFPAMLDAIAGAQRTITFENFVFAEGKVSTRFARALAERARAGVKVHFLQDAMGCNCLHGEEMAMMKRAGVQVEIFRYMKLTRFNQRTHRKILVIDGRVGFTGGVGISDDWDGDADAPTRWRDTHYRLEGPVVAQLQQAFMDNWMETRAVVLHGDDYFPALKPAGETTCQVFKSSASDGGENARLMVLLSIAAARRSIHIGNAYFIPDDLTIQTLVAARRRGVEIEVVVPGPLIDEKLARMVSVSRWGPLLRAGVRIYEYGPALYHCKYMVVDGCWSSVGSTNLDNRSLRLNAEANLNVHDTGFAEEHERLFAKDRAASREITLKAWRHRPMREKVWGLLGSVLRTQM